MHRETRSSSVPPASLHLDVFPEKEKTLKEQEGREAEEGNGDRYSKI